MPPGRDPAAVGPPADVMGVALAWNLLLAQTSSTAVWLGAVTVFPTGVLVDVHVATSDPIAPAQVGMPSGLSVFPHAAAEDDEAGWN